MLWLWLLPAAALAIGGHWAFSRLPHPWFCDYGETPDPNRKKLPFWAAVLCFALLALCVFSGRGEGFLLAVLLLFAAVCFYTAAADVLYRILPDQFVLLLGVLGLCFRLLAKAPVYGPLLGMVLAGGVVLLMGILGKKFFKAEAMGFGDVKLACGLGLFAGFPHALAGLVLSVLLGGIFALPLLFRKAEERYLPFGPFLCAGFLVAELAAKPLERFLTWYISMFS